MAVCKKCKRTVSGDEIGLNLKLIDRSVTEYLCISCMAGFFSCTEELLRDKVRRYREIGCKLFPTESDLPGVP